MRDLPHNTQLAGDVFIPNTSKADPMDRDYKTKLVRHSTVGAMWRLHRVLEPSAVAAKLRAMHGSFI